MDPSEPETDPPEQTEHARPLQQASDQSERQTNDPNPKEDQTTLRLGIDWVLGPARWKDALLAAGCLTLWVVLVLEVLARGGHISSIGWRPWIGVAISVGATSLAMGWVLSALIPDPVPAPRKRLRRRAAMLARVGGHQLPH